MKKVLSVFLALVMLLSVFTVGVSAYEFTEYVFIYTSLLGAEVGDYLYSKHFIMLNNEIIKEEVVINMKPNSLNEVSGYYLIFKE